jgi:hypothetical protein
MTTRNKTFTIERRSFLPVPTDIEETSINTIVSYNETIYCEYGTDLAILRLISVGVPDEVCVAIASVFEKIRRYNKIKISGKRWEDHIYGNRITLRVVRPKRNLYTFHVVPAVIGSGSASDTA